MSFLKHLIPTWDRITDNRTRANDAVLSALNSELSLTEQEAIESKVESSLKTSTGEWLDQYGKWFGLPRREGEEDDKYRERIIRYVLLKRGTILAIKDAIREFLQDYESHIDIYEPHRNIFTLNKSKLNGEDHLMGRYYNIAVIDIKFSKPFPPEIVDVINAFKPAGVTYHLTYRPGAYSQDAEIVELPLANSEIDGVYTTLKIMVGLSDIVRTHMNLTNSTGLDNITQLFKLNDSKLNSLDVLSGSTRFSNYMHYGWHSHEDFIATENTSMADMFTDGIIREDNLLSDDFYVRTGAPDGRYGTYDVGGSKDHMYYTLNLQEYLEQNYNRQLKEESPTGVYNKDTFHNLLKDVKIAYRARAVTPPTEPLKCSLQVQNLTTKKWETLSYFDLIYEWFEEDVDVTEEVFEKAVSHRGVLFTRITVEGLSPGEKCPVHMDYFEVRSYKFNGTKPVLELGGITEASADRILTQN